MIIFKCFLPLGSFSQSSPRKVKDWLILELREIIRVLYAVTFPIDFNLLCHRSGQREVLKLMKNDDFLVL